MSNSNSSANPWNMEKPYAYGSSWIISQPYLEIVNYRITGNPKKHWFNWSTEEYINRGDTSGKACLILGSNEGWMEIALRQSGFKGRIVASDIADKALGRARRRVEELNLSGIEHVRADLNLEQFPEDSFDFVIAEGVLHHVENINFCLDGLQTSLKSGGLLIGMEFVGAYRFQFGPTQCRWINAALGVLPRKYRPVQGAGDLNTPPDEETKATVYYVPMTIDEILKMDPSEAVSGHLIMPALRDRFALEVLKNAGGAIIMNISGHFPFELTNTDKECKDWLLVMADIERILYEQNIVPSDNVYFVCKKPFNDAPYKGHPDIPVGFEAARYLALNDDLRNAGIDPYQHYVTFGKKEGRKW